MTVRCASSSGEAAGRGGPDRVILALLLDLPYMNRLIFRYEFDPDIGPGPFDLETRSYHTIRSKPPVNQWFCVRENGTTETVGHPDRNSDARTQKPKCGSL